MDGCGVSCWHLSGLQKFANIRWFTIVYGLLGTIQSASYLYFVITLTTIEKRFKIPSQTTGIILSGNEVSQILLSLILTYYGGQRNRPRWIARGIVFSALSCFILTLPHFIYGPGEEAFQLTKEYLFDQRNSTKSSSILLKPKNAIHNKLCQSSAQIDDECEEVFSYIPLVLIFLSQFALGIGNTLYYSLGQSYLDDNTKQKNTPLMLAFAQAMRMFGPAIGFGLGYLVMQIYIDPRLTPIIDKEDLRWLGAWWLGWLLLGTLMFIFAGLIGMFPKHLPKKVETSVEEYEIDGKKCIQIPEITDRSEFDEKEAVNLKNFPKALMRLLKNKILIFNIFASICYLLGANGFITYMGRVMEVQFSMSSARGTIFTGPIRILGMVIGLLISGYFIKKLKPPPKYLFFWNVCIGLLSVIAAISYTQLGCDGSNSLLVSESMVSCNSNCVCDGIKFSPVCDRDTKKTYYSPCHAGCKAFDNNENVYSNCSCSKPPIIHKRSLSKMATADVRTNEIDNEEMNDDSNSEHSLNRQRRQLSQINQNIHPGACAGDCKFAYYMFSFIAMITSLIKSTGRIGNSLVNFRAVEPRDKAFAQGLHLFMISLFAMIPGPIIFGRIIDSTCLIWNYKCGRRGNCQLYDPVKFRYYLHSTAAIFIFFGAFFDFLVWYNGKHLELYGEANDESKSKKIEKTKNTDGDSEESEPLNK